MSETTEAPVVETPVVETQTDTTPESQVETKTEAKPEPKVEPPKKYKLKVNGQEREVDEKMLIALAQKGSSSDERFREAAKKQKEIEDIVKSGDPDKILKELLKIDPEEYSKNKIANAIKRLSMTPEQRELEDLRQKVQAAEKERIEREEQAKREAQSRATQHFVAKYDKEIPDALKKAGLPVNEDTVKYTAETMLTIMDEGLDPDEVTYDVIMDAVKQKYVSSMKSFFKASDVDALWALLGEDLDGLVKKRQEKASKTKDKEKPKQAVSSSEREKDNGQVFGSRDDFRDYVRKWAENGT